MTVNQDDETWKKLKPDSAFAVEALRSALSTAEESPESILDAYLYSKQVLAKSMQSLLLAQLRLPCPEFRLVCTELVERMKTRYSRLVPEKYLRVIYSGQAHERLFAVLLHSIGEPVHGERLRCVTGDSIHTERRVRELRELGLDVTWKQINGSQHYTLGSPTLASDEIAALAKKAIGKSSDLSLAEKERFRAAISESA